MNAEQIGASLYELEPGQKTWPYHFHYGEEELLVVLSGTPTLRDPAGERQLDPGDVVLFKRGPDGAHLLRNDSDHPVRLLMVSSLADVASLCAVDSGPAPWVRPAEPPAIQ